MNTNIKIIKFPKLKNCYIVISGIEDSSASNGVHCVFSFFYKGKTCGAEWEPRHGPISVVTKCKKSTLYAKKHYFYPYCTSDWSQLAVKEKGLPEFFLSGQYEQIFKVLKEWVS